MLDARYFGVPQRRRRVFVVGNTRSWQRAAAVLFERASLCGDSKPCGEAEKSAAAVAGGGVASVCRMRGFGNYIEDDTSSTLKTRDYRDATDLIVVHGRQDPCVSNTAFALDCQHNGMTNVVCINGNTINKTLSSGGNGMGAIQDGTCYTLTATDRHAATVGARVRRLTPLECERLQGFPDHHTRIPWRGKPAEDCPDGLRYRAIGNSMAVPVMRWIGERIQAVANIA